MDVKEGELVNVVTPDTRFKITSLADAVLVDYFEGTVTTNGALPIKSMDIYEFMKTSGQTKSHELWFVSDDDPGISFKCYWEPADEEVVFDYIAYGEKVFTEYGVPTNCYLYQIGVGLPDGTIKNITSSNFEAEKETLRTWDGLVTLEGGEPIKFIEMIKLEGKIRSKIVTAGPNFVLSDGTFSCGQGELSLSEPVVSGQYVRLPGSVADVPVTLIDNKLRFSSTVIEIDGAIRLTSISELYCSWTPSEDDIVVVDWNTHTYNFPDNTSTAETAMQLVHTDFINSGNAASTAVPDVTKKSRMEIVATVNTNEVIEFRDSMGNAEWGIEVFGTKSTYEIYISCSPTGTGDFTWDIHYRYGASSLGDWTSKTLTTSSPFSSIKTSPVSQSSIVKVYQ
jgi:hypothetical protein